MSLRNVGSTLEEFSKESESLMDYIVISDKKWAYYFYPETKKKVYWTQRHRLHDLFKVQGHLIDQNGYGLGYLRLKSWVCDQLSLKWF